MLVGVLLGGKLINIWMWLGIIFMCLIMILLFVVIVVRIFFILFINVLLVKVGL